MHVHGFSVTGVREEEAVEKLLLDLTLHLGQGTLVHLVRVPVLLGRTGCQIWAILLGRGVRFGQFWRFLLLDLGSF